MILIISLSLFQINHAQQKSLEIHQKQTLIDNAVTLLNSSNNATSITQENLRYEINIANYAINNTQLKTIDVYDKNSKILHLFKLDTATQTQTLHQKVFN